MMVSIVFEFFAGHLLNYEMSEQMLQNSQEFGESTIVKNSI